ncbi:HAD family phosphatase [Paracoccaceae bacterium]|nr:HAD family phosphatase [Paracoccaceae bacterium]
MRQAEAVIFDLDGCLVDTECLSIQAIVDEMLRLGIGTVSFEEIRDKFLGISMQKICKELADQVEGFNADRFVSRFETRLFAEYETKVPLIKGAFEMLLSLEQAGVPIGLATGGSLRRMQKTLEHSGLSGWLQNRAFSAEQVNLGKPAPDLFLLAASQLGFAPENCFVLEDSPHGVAGGCAAGMTVLGFVGGSHLAGIREKHASLLRAKGAAAVVSNLKAATDLFLSRGGRDYIQREVD